MIVVHAFRTTLSDMTEVAPTPAQEQTVDLGLALSSLLRRYLEGARDVVDDLPGGPRGFQVLIHATSTACENQATIAQRLGLDRTVMTYLVDDLEKAGLVERRPDPADRRARQIVLTARGTTVLAASTEAIARVERAVLGGLSEAEADVFRDLLARATSDTPPDHADCEAVAGC